MPRSRRFWVLGKYDGFTAIRWERLVREGDVHRPNKKAALQLARVEARRLSTRGVVAENFTTGELELIWVNKAHERNILARALETLQIKCRVWEEDALRWPAFVQAVELEETLSGRQAIFDQMTIEQVRAWDRWVDEYTEGQHRSPALQLGPERDYFCIVQADIMLYEAHSAFYVVKTYWDNERVTRCIGDGVDMYEGLAVCSQEFYAALSDDFIRNFAQWDEAYFGLDKEAQV
jgi:hypothetical protein